MEVNWRKCIFCQIAQSQWFSLLLTSFFWKQFLFRNEKFEAFVHLIFRHSGLRLKLQEVTERLNSRKRQINKKTKSPVDFLTKCSQGLLKVFISVLMDIYRQNLFSKKKGIFHLESACALTSFHVVPNYSEVLLPALHHWILFSWNVIITPRKMFVWYLKAGYTRERVAKWPWLLFNQSHIACSLTNL